MIQKKTCKEFRSTGLLLLTNQILHVFGWAIVVEEEVGIMYPARVRFRGFDEKSTSKAYVKISEYMKENADELLKESME